MKYFITTATTSRLKTNKDIQRALVSKAPKHKTEMSGLPTASVLLRTSYPTLTRDGVVQASKDTVMWTQTEAEENQTLETQKKASVYQTVPGKMKQDY